jgi:hypothetical protein
MPQAGFSPSELNMFVFNRPAINAEIYRVLHLRQATPLFPGVRNLTWSNYHGLEHIYLFVGHRALSALTFTSVLFS